MTSNRSIHVCTQYVGSIIKCLQNAGLEASFMLKTTQSSVVDAATQGPNQPAGSQSLIRNLLQPIGFNMTFTILPNISLTIRGRTFLFPVTTTVYYVVLPPSSPLQDICPPYADGYSDAKGLFSYIRTTTEHAISNHIFDTLSASNSTWMQRGKSIRNSENHLEALSFTIEEPAALVVKRSSSDSKNNETKSWRFSADQNSTTTTLEDLLIGEGL
jgi:mediator of RNA polymerase II transcription subunit 17